MEMALTCNYFTVTCEEHPSSASSCKEPSLSPASRCCSSQLSETCRSLVDLSPLMNSGCDLQGPEAEVPSVWILVAWGTRSQVGIKLHRQWPSQLQEQGGCFINSVLLIFQQSHLHEKEKKQNPESRPGTDHTVGHKISVSHKRRNLTMNGNISSKYLPSNEISDDSSPLEEPGPMSFEKCIIWAPGAEHRPRCFLLVPPHKTPGDTAVNDSWLSSSALPNVAFPFTGQIPTPGENHTS